MQGLEATKVGDVQQTLARVEFFCPHPREFENSCLVSQAYKQSALHPGMSATPGGRKLKQRAQIRVTAARHK